MKVMRVNKVVPKPMDDLEIAYCIGNCNSWDMGYIPKDLATAADNVSWELSRKGIRVGFTAHMVAAALKCLTGDEETNGLAPMIRTIKYDIRRMNQAFALIDEMHAHWEKKDLWKILPLRVMYGVPECMVELVSIPGIGGARAKKLWDAGIRSIADVADNSNKNKIYELFSPKLAKKVREFASETLRNQAIDSDKPAF
jgi:replicative superfamily II helicase